jgi:uncharacterized membrane protein
MNLSGEIGLGGLILSYVLLFWGLAWSVRHASWHKVQGDFAAQSVFGAMTVAVLLLWSLTATLQHGMAFHFLLMTTVTLMFGPAFAFLLACFAALGLTLSGGADWGLFAWNVLLMGGIPIAVTWWLAKLAYRFLDRNFFVFVLLNAFFAGALGALLAMFTMAGVMIVFDLQKTQLVMNEFVRYIPFMAIPEGFLNGFLVAGLVLFKPEWLACFSDEVYLKGK